MKYYPEGWNICAFTVTPEELESLLAGFHRVTFYTRVPRDYVESPPESLTAPWRCLYRKLRSPAPVNFQTDRDWFDWADGLTDDLSKCRYGAPFRDESTGEWFRLADFDEPCVGLRPFTLTIGEDGKLSTRFSYIQDPQRIAGLELHYPRKIAYFNETETGYSRVVPCEDTDTYRRVYEPLVQRIEALTVPLRFSAGGRNYRPKARISPRAKEDFPGFLFAQEVRLQLK